MWNLRREVFGDDPSEALAIMRWAKEASGITEKELAQRMGLSQWTIYHYTSGSRPNPGWRLVMRWLRACGFRVVLDREGAPE